MSVPIRIYTIGPMTAPSSWEWEQNIRRAEELYFRLSKEGFAVHCPHLQGRYFRDNFSHEDIMPSDKAWLACAAAAVTLPNWQKSRGSLEEVEMCKHVGIPFYHDEYDLIYDRDHGRLANVVISRKCPCQGG